MLNDALNTMAANFHSDSILATSASALILSAITVISILMLDNSLSSPSSAEVSSSSNGDSSGPYPGLTGDPGTGSLRSPPT